MVKWFACLLLKWTRPDDVPAHARLGWHWSEKATRVDGPGHEFKEFARPV